MNLKSLLLCVMCSFSQLQLIAQPCNLNPVASYIPSTLCSTRPIYLYGNSTVTGVSYSWSGPGGFTSTLQNPIVSAAIYTGLTDTFFLTVSKPGCTSEKLTLPFSVTPTPFGGFLYVRDTVCTGDTLFLVASGNLSAGRTNYIWGNGYLSSLTTYLAIPNAGLKDTGLYYAYEGRHGTYVCPSDTDTFHLTPAYFFSPRPPKHTVTVAAPGNTGPYKYVTFVATTNAGNYPKYQWYKNGVAIPSAISQAYMGVTGIDLFDGDSVSVRVIRTSQCLDTVYSNSVGISINLSVEELQRKKQFYIYPNPNNGVFTIIGHCAQQEHVNATITNALGQIVYYKQLTAKKQNEITVTTTALTPGVYYLSLRTDTSNERLKFVVE